MERRSCGNVGTGWTARACATFGGRGSMKITEGMLRAARLDASLYEEVEADRGLTGQATTVVLLTIGFASSPGVIRILGIIPGLVRPAFAVAHIWMLVAMVVAVHQALDYTSSWRAAGVVLVGWLIQALLLDALLRGAFF